MHAALNDLPVALLLASVIFDLLGAVLKKETMKAAGYWTLIGGLVGGGLAAIAGLMAEKVAEHGEETHAMMETHETFAFVTVGLFVALAVWRTARRGMLGKQEQTIYSTAGIIGAGLLIFTANLGGRLVWDRGMGLDGHVLQRAIDERREGHEHAHERETAVPAPGPTDTVRVPGDTTRHP